VSIADRQMIRLEFAHEIAEKEKVIENLRYTANKYDELLSRTLDARILEQRLAAAEKLIDAIEKLSAFKYTKRNWVYGPAIAELIAAYRKKGE
jgi:uncharacterized protein YigA (DUF484 family)